MNAAAQAAKEQGYTAPSPAKPEASELDQFAELLNYIRANDGLPVREGTVYRPLAADWSRPDHPARKLGRIWMMAQTVTPAGPKQAPAVAVFAKWLAGEIGTVSDREREAGAVVPLADALEALERDAEDAVVERERRERAESVAKEKQAMKVASFGAALAERARAREEEANKERLGADIKRGKKTFPTLPTWGWIGLGASALAALGTGIAVAVSKKGGASQ